MHTNPTVAVPVGALSTISFEALDGDLVIASGGGYIGGVTKSLDLKDLACPTWGVKGHPVSGFYTVGPPYNPIIVPPQQLLSLDPKWRNCKEPSLESGAWYISCGLYDPPFVLTPTSQQIPVITQDPQPQPVSIDPAPITSPSMMNLSPAPSMQTSDPPPSPIADPSQAIQPPPKQTSNPDPADPSPIPDPPQSQPPSVPSEAPQGDPGSSNPSQDPPQADPGSSNPPQDPPQADPGSSNPSQDPPQSPPETPQQPQVAPQPVPGSPSTPQNSPLPQVAPNADPGNQGRPNSPSIGAIILSAFGSTGASSIDIPASPSATIIENGQTINVINPTQVAVDGVTLTQGGKGTSVGGVAISLAPPNGNGGDPYNGQPANAVPISTFAIAGQQATADPGGVQIAGTRLSQGGPAITIAGTQVSVGPSNDVIIGSQTIALPSDPQDPNAPLTTLTAGGQAINAYPGALDVDGTVLTVGGSGLTLVGTPISLAPNGLVKVGNSAITIPTEAPGAAASALSTFTVDGVAVTAYPNELDSGGSQYTIGGSALIISGTPISAAPSGIVKLGTSALTLPTVAPAATEAQALSTFAVGGEEVTAFAGSLDFDGVTLTAGGSATVISGSTLSLGPSGVVQIGGSSITLATGSSSATPFISAQDVLRPRALLSWTLSLLLAFVFVFY